MQAIGQVYFWARVGVLALVMVLLVFGALVQMRPRKANVGMLVVGATLNVSAFLVIVWLSGVSLNTTWAAVFVIAGALLGWPVGRAAKIGGFEGNTAIKQAPWMPLATVVAYGLATASLLFGTSITFSVAGLLMGFAAGMAVVATIAEILKVRSAQTAPAPAPAPTSGAPA
jgi:hypothetical protein